uniref:NADH-ubiquinone oxidoreductase chain 2 n=1 Tax=Thaumalea sp. ZK-2019 TaxID=2527954 RepID=A0A411NHK4_9DIPT|nr:NADH dehydrogenase subunit 2 [Thaumalea sp. ZK-2019]
MFKNPSKLLFFFTLMTGSLMTISANSWLGAWAGLEINLLSFIPLMMDTKNLMSTEATLKYFLTQALASALLLFATIIIMTKLNFIIQLNNHSHYVSLIILSSLLLKSGSAPFHFWFPSVMEGLSWWNNFILMTWQKMAPLMLVSYCLNFNFIIIVIICCSTIGALGGLNQTSLRKLMAFSSINHLGWMLASMLYSDSLWLMYYLTYTFLTFNIIFILNSYKIFHINQAFSQQHQLPIIKFMLMISLLSLGGLPPFLGFFPKWMVIQSLTNYSLMFLLLIMVSLTLVTLFFYLRICYSGFMLNYPEMAWNNKMHFNNKTFKISIYLTFISMGGLFILSLITIFI